MSLDYINIVDCPSPNIDAFSPPLPLTPSYNGSYHNSPYSSHSELHPDIDNLLFDPDNPIDYNPAEYDPPQGSSLLMFTDPQSDFHPHYDNTPQLSLTPAQASFDYSSPSSNGAPDSANDPDRPIRSRASSVASNHVPHHSPRLDVAHTFENMRFESPAWQNNALPPDRPLSPSIKPQSPPQLRIPSSPGPSAAFPQPPPIINAPAGDGGLSSGPQLHIVPATPISGGGAAQTQPFQNRIQTLRQLHSNRQSSAWSELTLQEETQPVSQLPAFNDQSQQQSAASYAYSPDQNQINNDYLYSSAPRLRSKSDTQLQPPNWNAPYPNQDRNDASALDDASSQVSIRRSPSHQISQLPRHPASADSLHTTFNIGSSPAVFAPPFTFGGGPSGSTSNNGFLSPDIGLRRSKSDAGSRPGHQRLSRSEDIRSPSLLFPPNSQQDFVPRSSQYLSPQEPVPAIRGAHHRRASSGSRYGLNGGVERSDPTGFWSSSSSARASPYPSPNASPRVRYDELPTLPPPRYLPPPEDTRSGGLGLDLSGTSQESRGRPQSKMESDLTSVAKPNVTTGRTANASHKRRKGEATFVCPIPKCGSTFTRSFNLRGHLRSHNEERPFQCHWPGCGKGFARQHDCKRHEQLHTNYRPYTCEGCSKQFARMDALNRHLRSEGGAECQKTQQASARGSDYEGSDPPQQQKRRSQQQQQPAPVPKTEADTSNWSLVL